MAFQRILLIAALVAQECLAVPVRLPTGLFPSYTLSEIPLPTGAHLDNSRPTFLPSFTLTGHPLVTGAPDLSRTDGKSPPLLPSLTEWPTPTGLPSDLPSLTGVPTGLPSLTSLTVISLPTTLPETSSSSLLSERGEATLVTLATGLPSGFPTLTKSQPDFPTGFPTGLPWPSSDRNPGGQLVPGRV